LEQRRLIREDISQKLLQGNYITSFPTKPDRVETQSLEMATAIKDHSLFLAGGGPQHTNVGNLTKKGMGGSEAFATCAEQPLKIALIFLFTVNFQRRPGSRV
jgi:hypothetical protein